MSDKIERPPCPRSSVYKLRCPHEDWAAARIKELEDKLDKALKLAGAEFQDGYRHHVMATKSERDAIEAATTERCASHIEKLGWTAAANSIREMKAETIK